MANCRHIENRFSRIFRFPTAFWASASGGFRIVSDTLVNLSVITIYCCHRQTSSLTLAVVVGPWVWGDAKKLPGQLSRPRPRPRPIGHKNGLEAKAWPRGRATSEDITGSTSLVFLASFQDIRTCLAYVHDCQRPWSWRVLQFGKDCSNPMHDSLSSASASWPLAKARGYVAYVFYFLKDTYVR